jgi:hypothetical protein
MKTSRYKRKQRKDSQKKIIIGKGVKQSCPLNPSLFNLRIDPLIRNIREKYQEGCYNYDGEERKVIQAYADDLLILQIQENI